MGFSASRISSALLGHTGDIKRGTTRSDLISFLTRHYHLFLNILGTNRIYHLLFARHLLTPLRIHSCNLFFFFSDGKESACNAGYLGLIPGLGRSPGERNGNPLQHSFLENPMDRGAWQATVHGVSRVGHD